MLKSNHTFSCPFFRFLTCQGSINLSNNVAWKTSSGAWFLGCWLTLNLWTISREKKSNMLLKHMKIVSIIWAFQNRPTVQQALEFFWEHDLIFNRQCALDNCMIVYSVSWSSGTSTNQSYQHHFVHVVSPNNNIVPKVMPLGHRWSTPCGGRFKCGAS